MLKKNNRKEIKNQQANLAKWKKLEAYKRMQKGNIGNWELIARNHTDFIRKT